ncbi:MAG: IS66 family transposase [Sinobacteraceae bacterium]|nr:IS66 family transposase [Nevskiaceae bacterium]
MDAAALNAITDADTLRALVREKIDVIVQHEAAIAQRDRTIHARDLKIDQLTHELARLRRVHFSAKTEAMDAVQRGLFDEAMAADIAAVEAELEALRPPANPTPHARRKPARRVLPADLPREETVHEPEHTDCTVCGQHLIKIGEHVSEKLDVKPLECFVRRDVYPQYACRHCETIVAEPVAPALIDRGLAAPGLLAQVAIQKYADHLPLYRQEAIFARHGVELSRTTLAEWIGVIGLRLQPLVDALHAKLLQASVLHADETPVQQLDPGKGKTKRAYLFAYCNTHAPSIIVFDYRPSRAGKHAAAFLSNWQGALMVDAYAGYKQLFEHGVIELACWAHTRRKFYDAWKANGSPIAHEALERIGELYGIEAKLRDLNDVERGRHRARLLGPLLARFKTWLDEMEPKVMGNTGLAKAIAYARKRWSALARVIDNGAWPIDNNPIERAIRPIAIGRKNWLFAGSETAGQRAAAIMSLIATAKANGIEPHAWLTDVLTRLPTTKDRDIDSLLPLP